MTQDLFCPRGRFACPRRYKLLFGRNYAKFLLALRRQFVVYRTETSCFALGTGVLKIEEVGCADKTPKIWFFSHKNLGNQIMHISHTSALPFQSALVLCSLLSLWSTPKTKEEDFCGIFHFLRPCILLDFVLWFLGVSGPWSWVFFSVFM